MDIRSLPKPHSYRSRKYLRWIRLQPCVICGKGAEAAHIGFHGLGIKASDFMTLPCCHFHHQTARESLTAMTYQDFGDFYNVNILQAIIDLLSRYMVEHIEDLEDKP